MVMMMRETFDTGKGSGGSPANQTPLTIATGLPLALVQNQYPYSSTMRATPESTEPELGLLEAELRRMREANDSLMQEIRMQQLVSERNDMMINPMMLQQQQQQQQQQNGGETFGENEIGGHVGGLQTASAYVDVAGGSLGFPVSSPTTAAATGGGMKINSSTSAAMEMRAGVMGMQRSMNTMMMPNSIMVDGNGVSDMNSNSSLSVPCTSSLTDSFTSMTGTSISSCNSTSTAAASYASDITHPISNVSNTDEMPDAEEQELQASDEPNWERRYRELVQYKSEHGHTRVPARWKCNPQLGRWVMTQRRQFTILIQGHPSPLTADRMNRLNEIGFQWALRADKITMWNRMFSELKTFKEEFGNCVVPQRYPANPKLGTWVHTQRRQYKLMLEGKKSAMNEEKIAALDSLGFTWVAKTNGMGGV